jgi:hypothetical protein
MKGFLPDPIWIRAGHAGAKKIFTGINVFFATLATPASGIFVRTVRVVISGLLPAPTSTSKIRDIRPKKAHFMNFFLASFAAGPKMFRLLRCARIAEQHWVSTEANT